jgi:hypothetical protein
MRRLAEEVDDPLAERRCSIAENYKALVARAEERRAGLQD